MHHAKVAVLVVGLALEFARYRILDSAICGMDGGSIRAIDDIMTRSADRR